jgi:hypothetical protein
VVGNKPHWPRDNSYEVLANGLRQMQRQTTLHEKWLEELPETWPTAPRGT